MRVLVPLTLLLWSSLSWATLSAAESDTNAVPPDEAELLIESLRAGLHQWERDVAFKSTYVSRTGKAHDLADPETGDYVSAEIVTQGSGVLIKDGPNLCRTLDFDIGGLRLISPLPKNGSRPRKFETAGVRPVHQLSSEAATLFYQPETTINGTPGWTSGGSAYFQASTRDELSAVTETQFHGFVTPLSPTPKAGIPLSSVLDPNTFLPRSSTASIERRVFRRDGDVVEVVAESQTRTIRLLFWTAPFPPVLKAMFKTDSRPTKFGTYEYRSVLSDFRQCRNGLVPARIVTTSKWGLRNSSSFNEWISEDLGNEDPVISDFVLNLPADAFIGGMTELPPVEDGVRPIRVDGLRHDRVAQLPQRVADIIDPSAPPKTPINPPGNGRLWFLMLFNGLVVGGVATYLTVSKRRRLPQRQHG